MLPEIKKNFKMMESIRKDTKHIKVYVPNKNA